MSSVRWIMGRDQYGNEFHHLEPHPRKALRARLGGRIAKMYSDRQDGRCVHHGYVVGQHWITLYWITPWEQPA